MSTENGDTMKNIVLDGDQAVFIPSFPPATVVPIPGTISGTGDCKSSGSTVCVEGDEDSVSVSGVVYISGAFVTPGSGTLTISSLGSDQVAPNGKSGGKVMILQGSQFTAKFEVSSPAVNPNSGVTDPVTSYSGNGMFVTTDLVASST